ncbi:MAG: GTP-binding protein [Flavobacteriia bacterium]|nr:GTP-binding protein [Flavobacteriia bacterium]
MGFLEEIKRRRTFGIISHPDAGKTTLTEKLLLFGGAIQEAGAVKSNKIKKTATSDFMEIERQRGISVATSVLAFHYQDKKINILDTPGHKDFAEDTFRTLTAVDSVIVVIDVAKGVEEQTEKLVLDEVEQKLGLKVTPLSLPIGMGYTFKGIYNIWENNIQLFEGEKKQTIGKKIHFQSLEDPKLQAAIGAPSLQNLKEELELIQGVYPKFNRESYLKGALQPVLFGSALNNFGVEELLNCFVAIAPEPLPKDAEERLIEPKEADFSGFVFKIHANMDPNHRDRLAFVKVVSGTFKRNNPYLHVRLNKKIKFAAPNTFFAERKEIVDTSYPGDIVGLHDTGNFKIGDTLTAGEVLHFKGIPSFSPEHFRYINNNELQFEVIQYRLLHEYGAQCGYENLNVFKACWIEAEEKNEDFKEFNRIKQKFLAYDKSGKLVFLADSAFSLQMAQEQYPDLKFHFTSEF